MKKSIQIVSYVAVAVAAYVVISHLQGDGSGHNHHEETHAHGKADHGDDHGHSHDSPDPHDSHAHDHGHAHGHGATPEMVYTHFTEQSELFVEFPALVVGEESVFIVHLNDLTHFKPLRSGAVTVTLRGGEYPDERFFVAGPSMPGIFRTPVLPEYSGRRTLSIVHEDGGVAEVHDLGNVVVFRSTAEARSSITEEEEPSDTIPYPKEQAWMTDFATVAAEVRPMAPSLAVPAIIRTRPSGDARVLAPSQGFLLPAADLLHIGQPVRKNDVVARFMPFLGDAADLPHLDVRLTHARLAREEAQRDHARMKELFHYEAVPEKRLHQARMVLEAAEEEFREATARLEQARSSSGIDASRHLPLRSPIDGVIGNTHALPGVLLEQGTPLFRVVDPSVLWLEVKVPESMLGRTLGATAAWFTVKGYEQAIHVGGAYPGKLIASGMVVDPVTRTASFFFEFPNRHELRAGMLAHANLLTGDPTERTAVPATAIIDDDGQSVVYVQLDGETFQRRPIRPGIRQGAWVSIEEGVTPGERVVSRGAYRLRLASATDAVPDHGHAH